MKNPVDYAISHSRLTLALLLFLLLAGLMAYFTIPKEAEPDVKVPIVYVQLSQRGISPEDSERLLLRPMETQLKSVANVKEMRSTAYEGGGFVLLEFEAGFDSNKAVQDVRAKVDDAKRDLPKDADQPSVREVNLSLFPVLVVGLTGDVPERTLLHIARTTKNALEQIPGVLSADLKGARDEVVEIIAEPMLLKSYGISIDALAGGVSQSNSLVAAGALEGGTGRFAVKVPALIERPEDILKLPVAATSGAAVTLGDVAEVRPTFKDAETITRVNGKPAITIEVSKRTGSNLIETVDAVKYVVGEIKKSWPETVNVTFSQDKSKTIRDMLHELQNSVITAVLLVLVIMMIVLGGRASLFIGIAIPASFLAGILALQTFGLTVNIVVLFALILAVGMLVDDAIIVSEYAERRMAEGVEPRLAFSMAAKRMAGPVISATLTRVAAFSPLMFWPGIVGQFMKYLPLTLIATLSASLIVALFFTPTLGALLGKASEKPHDDRAKETGAYMRIVKFSVGHPALTLSATFFLLVAVIKSYGAFGNGVEFFPNVEPDYGIVQVRARGNLSITEKDQLVRKVEERLLRMSELKTIYARAGESQKGSSEVTEDTVGSIQFEFIEWQHRRKAHVIMEEIRQMTSDIAGVAIEVTAPKGGPPTGKAIQVQLSAIDPEMLHPAARKVAAYLETIPEVRDLDTGLPLPGIDWTIKVDKAEAAKFGASATSIGSALKLVTNGVKISEYRPNETDKSVDLIMRFPEDKRTLDDIEELRMNTPAGSVPIGNFVTREPSPRVSQLNRVAGSRVITVSSNVAEGVQSAVIQQKVMNDLSKMDLGPGVTFKMKGEDEERAKAGAFLGKAFGTAIFLIFAILLAQFNKFSSVMLVLSAVVLSTIGVLLGLMVMGQSFGVVMTGIGVIANAGVIVNNNIVLIDTYDRLRRDGVNAYDAIIETCRERARPVVLTAVTAILGVLAIAFGINLDFVNRDIFIGAPSTQWWVHLSTAIVFGLGFATILTLVVTPAALMAIADFSDWRAERRKKREAKKHNTDGAALADNVRNLPTAAE